MKAEAKWANPLGFCFVIDGHLGTFHYHNGLSKDGPYNKHLNGVVQAVNDVAEIRKDLAGEEGGEKIANLPAYVRNEIIGRKQAEDRVGKLEKLLVDVRNVLLTQNSQMPHPALANWAQHIENALLRNDT